MKIHFIGIGERVLCDLALILKNFGYKVGGSDQVIEEPALTKLKKNSLLPEERGWDPDKIESNLDAIIIGSGVQDNNPELETAKQLGIKIYTHPEFLFELCKEKTRVVIGGFQTKGDVAAMILHVMQYHQKDIDFLISRPLNSDEESLSLSDHNDFILIEGDEFSLSTGDGCPAFQVYQPNIALLSEIKWNNQKGFSTEEEYVTQFHEFIDSIVKGGILVYNKEDENLAKLAEETENQIRKHPYATPVFQLVDDEIHLETPEGDMPLENFQKKQLSSLAGAKWICQHMGIDEDDFYEAIIEFEVNSIQG